MRKLTRGSPAPYYQNVLGTSITDVFKTAVTAPFKIASNPTVRSATLTALKNNQYTSSYASAADIADRAVYRDRGQVRAPRQQQMMPMMPMEPPAFGPDGEPTSSPVQQGNLLLIGGVAIGALLLIMMMRK